MLLNIGKHFSSVESVMTAQKVNNQNSYALEARGRGVERKECPIVTISHLFESYQLPLIRDGIDQRTHICHPLGAYSEGFLQFSTAVTLQNPQKSCQLDEPLPQSL